MMKMQELTQARMLENFDTEMDGKCPEIREGELVYILASVKDHTFNSGVACVVIKEDNEFDNRCFMIDSEYMEVISLGTTLEIE